MPHKKLDLQVPLVPELHARRHWVAACGFHTLGVEEVLREVSTRVSLHKDAIVLLDLDSTLYEVGRRTHFILQEWAQSPLALSHADARAAILEMKHEKIGYSIRDTFSNIDLEAILTGPSSAFEDVRKFWSDRFFTSSYLVHDCPYPGAVEFVRNLYRLGAQIVYLTGRDEPNMGEGTRTNLIRDGFPWNLERTQLMMKPAAHLDDLEFKKQAAGLVNSQGKLIASFENEPPNVAALHELLPEVMHVFVDTVCSERLALPRNGLYRIAGFVD